MKILIVENDPRIAKPLAEALTNQHYIVNIASDGETGWDFIKAFPYKLLLINVILPRLDGISFCRRLRSQDNQVPILLLSAKGTVVERITGLDAGADDYLIQPFDVQELAARIRVLLRRRNQILPTVLKQGGLALDTNTCVTTYQDQLLKLTPKEYRILELLVGCHSRVWTRNMILEHLWSFDDPPGEDTVKAHIRRLRQKLKEVGAPRDLIETVYGLGYRLKANL